MSNKYYIIYGSGDPGTAEVINAFQNKGVPFVFRDLRKDKGNIVTLIGQRLNTVPQVFMPDGTHIGGYEEAMAYLRGEPKGELILLSAEGAG